MLAVAPVDLANGQYTIVNKAACECSFVWSLSEDKKELLCTVLWGNSFHTSTLIVDEAPLLTIIHRDPVYFHFHNVKPVDIPSVIINKMMTFHQVYDQTHFINKRQSLINWLMYCGFMIGAEKKNGKHVLLLVDVGKFWKNNENTAGIFADAFLKKGIPFRIKKSRRF